MSTPGSAPTELGGSAASYSPAAAPPPPHSGDATRRRIRLVRWQGLVPLALLLFLLGAGWLLFGDRVAEQTAEEAATKLLGTQVDIAAVRLHESESRVELRGLEIADPFDPKRNVLAAERIEVELEPVPLLEKKLIVRRLSIAGVRLGTARATPARPVSGDGFAATTLRGLREWAARYEHPVLALTPLDTIRDIVLDPAQLGTVRAATALAARADSVKGALESGWRGLELRAVFDSSEALVRRLAGASPRTLGIDGTRRAVADVRRALKDIETAKTRVDALQRDARSGVVLLDDGVRGLDAARRDDYAFALGLLKLPSLEGPQIGGALFGPVTLDRYKQAVYWAELAQRYMPPGLRPRERSGPERLRAAGSTVAFPKARQYPDFLLRAGDIDFALADGAAAGSYRARVTDLTTAPALVGRPTRLSAGRDAAGSAVGAVRASAVLDHTRATPRDSLGIVATGVRLPAFPLPGLPVRVEPGPGDSRIDVLRSGDRIAARWTLRAPRVRWIPDSTRIGAASPLESLVSRVVSGMEELELTARITGPVRAPEIAIASNLDRVVADRLRDVAGEEVERAKARARAEVDRLVDEHSAPVRARVATLRAEADQRVAEARARLDEEQRTLRGRLEALSGGLGGVLR